MIYRLLIATLLVILISWVLAGCSTIRDAAEKGIDSAKQANDATLQGASTLYCDGMSTGAIVREYGQSADAWRSYWEHCNHVRGRGRVDVPPAE